jgi:two-component system, OmpR family, response regulator
MQMTNETNMNKGNAFSILLAEDDPNLSSVLQDYLEIIGYNVTLCENGIEALEVFNKEYFDLCIIDVMMPKKDGFSLAEDIRKNNEMVPIIFLTAKSLKEDRVKGFSIGCDDYITKPFSTEELSLRIKAIMKRCTLRDPHANSPAGGIFIIGNYTFDSENLLLTTTNKEIKLTRKEAALLKLLAERINQVLPRDLALKKIWGRNDYFFARSMDVFITKLRKHLKNDPDISIINLHGTGFKLFVDNVKIPE